MDNLDIKWIAFSSLFDVMLNITELFIYYKIAAMLFHFHICFD